MPPSSPSQLLLIDDDELARAILELHLTEAGYAVTEAESGDVAVSLLENGVAPTIDLVLSDLQMPGLCGPALAQRLRALLRPEVRVLAMSARQPTADGIRGFDAFLLKPFSPQQFSDALDRTTAGALALPVSDPQASPAGQVSAAAPPVLEDHAFAQLSSMLTPSQLTELFALSFSELRKHLARMEAAAMQHDGATLRESAHTIKGSFSMVGARELQAIGAVLEAGGQSPADQAASLREIPLAAERLRRMLTSRGLEVTHNVLSGQETE